MKMMAESEKESNSTFTADQIEWLRQEIRLLETDDYFFREYQSGSLIQNYIVDFDLKLSDDDGREVGWSPGGIFTENVNTFLTSGGPLSSEGPLFWDPEGATLENILAKCRAQSWVPPELRGPLEAMAIEGDRGPTAFRLSDLFKIISKVAVKPSVWIGSFCRSGIPFGTDDLLKCNLAGYDPLSQDFFSGKMVRDGGALTTQTSLSANVMTQNFKGMLKKIMRTKGLGGALCTGNLAGVPVSARRKLLDRDSKIKEENLRLLRVWSSTLVFEPLDYEDVCFILLLYNKIK
jgi:hypothetical protein